MRTTRPSAANKVQDRPESGGGRPDIPLTRRVLLSRMHDPCARHSDYVHLLLGMYVYKFCCIPFEALDLVCFISDEAAFREKTSCRLKTLTLRLGVVERNSQTQSWDEPREVVVWRAGRAQA